VQEAPAKQSLGRLRRNRRGNKEMAPRDVSCKDFAGSISCPLMAFSIPGVEIWVLLQY
jgi:hypothetical protein